LNLPDGLVVNWQSIAQDGLSVLDGIPGSQQGVGWGGWLQHVITGHPVKAQHNTGRVEIWSVCGANVDILCSFVLSSFRGPAIGVKPDCWLWITAILITLI
jgi:hypothetical protein